MPRKPRAQTPASPLGGRFGLPKIRLVMENEMIDRSKMVRGKTGTPDPVSDGVGRKSICREQSRARARQCKRIGLDGCPACTTAAIMRANGADINEAAVLRQCRDVNREVKSPHPRE